MGVEAPSYRGFRFPVEIISHGVWLYYRFPLSFREVEEMMLERGIGVSHETIRQWCAKFGQPTPTHYAGAGPARAISGTSTGTVNLAMIMIYFFFATPRCSSSSRAGTTTGCGSKIRIDQL